MKTRERERALEWREHAQTPDFLLFLHAIACGLSAESALTRAGQCIPVHDSRLLHDVLT